MSVAHKKSLARIAEVTCLSERTVRQCLHLFHTTLVTLSHVECRSEKSHTHTLLPSIIKSSHRR